MASGMKVPPPPLTTQDKSVWASWYIAIKDAVNKLSSSLKWTLLDFTGSNITDVTTRSHQDLHNLQGGSSTERYHLTSAQLIGLTNNGDTTIHYHASDRARANHTGTQPLATISDAGTAASQSGLSVTITTAPVTAGGATGSMTFTNGVLTAQTPAT